MERERVVWLCVVVALLAVGAAAWGAGEVDHVYYRLREVPLFPLPLTWTIAGVLLLTLVARDAPRHRGRWNAAGALLLGVALLLWPYTALEYVDQVRHSEGERAQVEGYVLVAETRMDPSESSWASECRLYLREVGGPFSREAAATAQNSCPDFRVSEDGTGFELLSSEGGVVGEVDPADHF